MKKKIELKPEVLRTPMSDLEMFKAQYGAEYKKIVEHPAFQAGMQVLNIRKLQAITQLQDDDIEKNGREILSDLRGHLKHETDLFKLHEQEEFKLPFEEEEEYFSPEQIAEVERMKEKFRMEQRKSRYG